MIRLMQATDVSTVAKIERLVQSHPWTVKQFEEAVTAYQSTVIEQNGQVLGFCILQPVLDEANLLLMAIDPSQQGKGLGFKLLDTSLAMLKIIPYKFFWKYESLILLQSGCMKKRIFIKSIYAKIIIRMLMVHVSMPLLW